MKLLLDAGGSDLFAGQLGSGSQTIVDSRLPLGPHRHPSDRENLYASISA